MTATHDCYHCGLPVPPNLHFTAVILGEPCPMCCHGCQAVAESIVQNGLQDYYRYRTELPKTADELVPEELKNLTLYDHPEVQKSFVFSSNSTDPQIDIKQASLILEGITCAACIWLNERHLKQLDGVTDVAFNYTSHRARVTWDAQKIRLSQILAEIRKFGYHAHPFSAQQQQALREQVRKGDFRRLAVAGLVAGQVMMIAVALYSGAMEGSEMPAGQLMRWTSLALSIPAMTYAAWPLYRAAWQGIANRRIGMDVPIVLGLLTGFIGSIVATLHGTGVVYYDTLTMLIFFLLTTRYLERNTREKSVEAAENLLRLVPAMATRIDSDDKLTPQHSLVPLVDIHVGDLILVRPGETIASDGLVEQGESSADESLLTGESRPVVKSVGSRVCAGSINYESPLAIRVTAIGENTMLASISRLLDRAQAEKPRLAELASQMASYFTYALLLLVVVVGLVWWQLDATRCLEIILTVLVVSCPCALSLAAPAAFAAAGSHLVQRGVLLTRGHALEALARVSHVVFDKTGTLTLGRPALLDTLVLANIDDVECLKLAASLEQSSEHAIAHSFIAAVQGKALYAVAENRNLPGQGIVGNIDGKGYWLGNASLNPGLDAYPVLDLSAYPPGASCIWLSDATRLLAGFILADTARAQAAELVQQLHAMGIRVSMLSGDSVLAVAHFAQTFGITTYQGQMTPAKKLSALQTLQAQGEIVAMIGDGINDAPVLAGAQVSIAMGSGTQMARATGDIVLLTENLLEIAHAIRTSRFAITVIRQNFAWAIGYNLIALPFAVTGQISPWMAAIGMSVSSLIVVLSALRLRHAA